MKKNRVVLYQVEHETMGKGWAGELFMPNKKPEKIFIKASSLPSNKAFDALCMNYKIKKEELSIDIYVFDI